MYCLMDRRPSSFIAERWIRSRDVCISSGGIHVVGFRERDFWSEENQGDVCSLPVFSCLFPDTRNLFNDYFFLKIQASIFFHHQKYVSYLE